MSSGKTKTKSRYAQAAASIKRELKAAFPGIAFSVRSKSFSMGNSVDVSWELGPTGAEVDAIIKKYQDGHFDGMTDSYEYDRDARRSAFRAIHGCAKYVSGQRSLPDGLFERICFDIATLQGVPFTSTWQRRDNDTLGLGDYAHRAMARCSFPAGAEYVGVDYSDELKMTGSCLGGDTYKIVHSKTDWVEDARAVVRREFDYFKSVEARQQPQLLVIAGGVQ